MEVIEIKDFKTEKQFLEIPFSIYQNDPHWICPPLVDVASLFDPSKNKAFEHGEAKRWIVVENGVPCGRIAAFYQRLESREEAGIGFFECIDSRETAQALFDVATNWLKEAGFLSIEGPINFGHRDSYWGLLVEGFTAPAFQDNYHPPYYRALFEDYGFVADFEQTTAMITREDFNAERLGPIAQKVMAKPGYIFRSFNMDDPKKMACDFCSIYNKAWKDHEHFNPVTEEEIGKMIKSMKPLVLPELISFAYVEEEPVGFYISLRDVNPMMASFLGKFGWLQKLQLFWRLKTQKPKKLRSIVFGVIPEFQNKGIETGMIWHFYQAIQRTPSIEEVELSWVGDFNPRMLKLLEGIGAKPWKKHITFKLIISA